MKRFFEIGTIFSKRKIENSNWHHCYLHSWIVDKDYRTQSFRLIIPILKKKNIFNFHNGFNRSNL